MSILEITLWTELFLFVLFLISAPLELWLHYLAIMNLKRVRNMTGLSKIAGLLGGYLLLRGYFLDLVVNVVHMSLYLREWPKELIVTKRLNRHIDGSTDRAIKCIEIREKLLNNYDPNGVHT